MASLYGRFVRNFPLVYYRENSVEVDLNDLRRTGQIPDAIGCDGTLRLHITDKKSPVRY